MGVNSHVSHIFPPQTNSSDRHGVLVCMYQNNQYLGQQPSRETKDMQKGFRWNIGPCHYYSYFGRRTLHSIR